VPVNRAVMGDAPPSGLSRDESRFTTLDGSAIGLFTLESAWLRAVVSAYGASLVALEVPDRAGERANVVLGHPSLEAYRTGTTYFGATIGRFANRIAKGRFTLDGCAYQIPCNDESNALHGGRHGFDKAVWHVVDEVPAAVRLRHVSADGDQGFPGCVSVDVSYTIEANALRLDYEATTDAPTVVNFTNHSYFNLDGEDSGDVYAHEVQIDAERYLPIDETSIPRGELRAVAGTPFDFRTPTPIGARIRTADEQLVNGRGYDHTFVLARLQPGKIKRCACVRSPRSGRFLACETDRPGLQFYTGNMLAGANRSRDGTRLYRQGDGFTLETQGFPDAPNQPSFPSTVLLPGETFRSTTVYRFGAR